MMSETITSDTFNPPCHDISPSVQNSLTSLLEEYDSQFTQDETSIGTTMLTSMTQAPLSCITKAIPHCYETL